MINSSFHFLYINQAIPCYLCHRSFHSIVVLPIWKTWSKRRRLDERKRAVDGRFRIGRIGVSPKSTGGLSKWTVVVIFQLLHWFSLFVFLLHLFLSQVVLIQLIFYFVESAEKGLFSFAKALLMQFLLGLQILLSWRFLVLYTFEKLSLFVSIYQNTFRIRIIRHRDRSLLKLFHLRPFNQMMIQFLVTPYLISIRSCPAHFLF